MNEPLSKPQNKVEDDEIDLREIWRVLVKYKRMIMFATFGAAIVAAGISLQLPNIYRAEVLLAPVQDDNAKSGGMAAALGGLGGLASLAGISMGSGGSAEENLAILRSREFLWKFVQDNKLMPIFFEDEWDEVQKKWKESDPKKQPGQMDVARLFDKEVLGVNTDKKSSLVTVTIEWKDPVLATAWADQLITQLNQYLRQEAIARSEANLKYLNEELARTQIEEMRKTLYDLIGREQRNAMLANAQRQFAFRVLDPAVVPDKKIKPKRTIIVLLAALMAGFMAVLVAFIRGRRQAEQN
ncbi:MAG: hypothetical protein HOO95_06290 [Gallionella sp.]|nr:hypothetical protein [Gallionella sp.]